MRISGVSGCDWKVFDRAFNERKTVAAFEALLEPGMTFFDVGANVGYFSLLAASIVGPEGRVHSFEPTPAVAKRLMENVRINALSSRVITNVAAIGERSGTATFHLHSDDSEANSMFATREHGGCIEVPVITLDEYVQSRNIRSVDLLKMDVEGAELLALRGAQSILARENAPMLIIELNSAALASAGSSPLELQGMLEEMGYRCHLLEELLVKPARVCNVLAMKNAHEQRISMLRSRLTFMPMSFGDPIQTRTPVQI